MTTDTRLNTLQYSLRGEGDERPWTEAKSSLRLGWDALLGREGERREEEEGEGEGREGRGNEGKEGGGGEKK